jgi:hypothetical protein
LGGAGLPRPSGAGSTRQPAAVCRGGGGGGGRGGLFGDESGARPLTVALGLVGEVVAARGDLARCELTTKLTSPSQSTPEDEQRQIEFQLYGAIAATSAVVPAMQVAGTGTLLYTTRAGSIDPITMLGNVNSAAAALRNRDPRARVGTACPRAAPPPG